MLVTARASVESAVAAIRLGVHDYLREPLDAEKLRGLLADRFDDALAAPRAAVPGGAFGRRLVLRHDRPLRADAGALPDCSARWRRTCARRSSAAKPAPARNSSRAPCINSGRARTGASSSSTARRSSRRSSRASCSATCAARSPGATDAKPGLFETGRRRHAVPRRSRRAAARRAGQAAAHDRVRRSAARRIARAAQGRRAGHRRDQPRPRGRVRRRALPPRSVLPAQRRRIHVPPLRDRRDDIVYLANAFVRGFARRVLPSR